jgi:hypothetical protein
LCLHIQRARFQPERGVAAATRLLFDLRQQQSCITPAAARRLDVHSSDFGHSGSQGAKGGAADRASFAVEHEEAALGLEEPLR